MLLVKLSLSIALLWVSGAMLGTSLLSNLARFRLNHPIMWAQSITLHETDHSALIIHDLKLTQVERQAQASIDDRKELHAMISTLTDRLNVDEAQAKTVGGVFGILLSILGGISTLVRVMEYRDRRKTPEPEPYRQQEHRTPRPRNR